jgi:hypothetical protein
VSKRTQVDNVALELGLELHRINLERPNVFGVAVTLDIDRDPGSPIDVADVAARNIAPRTGFWRRCSVRSGDPLGSETSTSSASRPASPDSSEPGGRSRLVAWCGLRLSYALFARYDPTFIVIPLYALLFLL